MMHKHDLKPVGSILQSIFGFIFYLWTAFVISMIITNSIASSLVSDCFICLCFGSLYFIENKKTFHFGKPEKQFSAFGWLIILLVFAAIYASSESIGNFLAAKFPIGITDTYANMQGSELYFYILFAVTIGPVSEELLFRYFMFKRMRIRRIPFWAAFTISTVLFTFVHGTVMHIPVTLALSLFLCILYEVTGRFRYCIIFHILFNYAGASLVFAIPQSVIIMTIVYVVAVTLLVLGYIFRDKVFGKYLKQGSLEQFEKYLDNKRKNFGKDEEG